MLRVLVADDDPGIVRTLMLGLKMMGCQPVGVESAEAAIKALEDKSADLLLDGHAHGRHVRGRSCAGCTCALA